MNTIALGRILLLALVLIAVTTPAFAEFGGPIHAPFQPAPAPLLGTGLSGIAVLGVFLARTIFLRWKK